MDPVSTPPLSPLILKFDKIFFSEMWSPQDDGGDMGNKKNKFDKNGDSKKKKKKVISF